MSSGRSAVAGAITLLLGASGARALAPGIFDANDGNLVLDGTEKDWANAPSLSVGTEGATGQDDDSFGQGTKEDSPVPTVIQGSIPPNKSDLDTFYVASETVSGKLLLYLAWTRHNTLGSANFDFELNKSNVLSSNGVTPVRSPGDRLITFDFASGGNQVQLAVLTWLTTGPTSACKASQSLPCWGNETDLDASNVAEGRVNDGFSVYDPIADVTRLSQRFGEAAVNLTDSGIVPAGSCTAFASAYVRSRSSDSFTSAVKDFVPPVATNLDVCGSIKARKEDDAGNRLAGVQFAIWPADGASDTIATDDVTGDPLATCTTGQTGECTMSGLNAGSYWLVETAGIAGYCAVAPPYRRVDLATDEDEVVLVENFAEFKVITLVCLGDALYASSVTLGGTTLTSLSPAQAATAGLNATTLCGIGGARFVRPAGTYAGSVAIVREVCDNGIDDDGDGDVDLDDVNCTGTPICTPEDCDNATDDDGDLRVDCDDPDCAGEQACP